MSPSRTRSLEPLNGYAGGMNGYLVGKGGIPLCYRTSRSLSHLATTSPQLFEPKNMRNRGPRGIAVDDNPIMWYPARHRPRWLTAHQSKERQLSPRRPTYEPFTFTGMKNSPASLPMAGSRCPSGKYPRSFDYSGGCVLQDSFYDLEKFGMKTS